MKEHRHFENRSGSIPEARHFVEATLAGLGTELVGTAALLVSELATNAVKHAGTGFDVVLAVEHERLHVEVSDDGEGAPVLRSPSSTDLGGRGLRIVEMLSSSWGVNGDHGTGKSVWFTLAVPVGASEHQMGR